MTVEKRLNIIPDVVSLSSEIAARILAETPAVMPTSARKRETLLHPEYGRLPARKVLDCIFALAPTGKIAHFHTEQVEPTETDGEILYAETGATPTAGRERCQVIPPFVREFDPPAFPSPEAPR